MTLYEMLDKGMAHQEVWIFEQNAYDQNMPLFKGTINGARLDEELVVWDYLMCEVDHYDFSCGILDIRVKDEYFNQRIEGHYARGAYWGKAMSERPWRYSVEISDEKRRKAEDDRG